MERDIKYKEIETFLNSTKLSFVTSEALPSGDYDHDIYYHDGEKEHHLANFHKDTDRVSASLGAYQKSTISSIRNVFRTMGSVEKTVQDDLNKKNKTLFMLRKLALTKCKEHLANEVTASAGKFNNSDVATGFVTSVLSKLYEEFGEKFVRDAVKFQSKKAEPNVDVKVNKLLESPLNNIGPLSPA